MLQDVVNRWFDYQSGVCLFRYSFISLTVSLHKNVLRHTERSTQRAGGSGQEGMILCFDDIAVSAVQKNFKMTEMMHSGMSTLFLILWTLVK